MKRKRWNHVLLALGVFGGLSLYILLLRVNGASKEVLNNVASGVMVINGLASTYLVWSRRGSPMSRWAP